MELNFKFLKKKKKFTKSGSNVKPHLYWRYILFFSLIVVVSSFIFGLVLFLRIDEAVRVPVINTDTQGEIRKERINKSLKYFDERQKKSEDIINSPSPIIDPSI